jgi:hypothetical protein
MSHDSKSITTPVIFITIDLDTGNNGIQVILTSQMMGVVMIMGIMGFK